MNTDYKRVEGGVNIPSFQKVNLRKGYYAVRWDFQTNEDENTVNYMETVFDHLPTEDEIRSVINKYYNEITDQKILSGFKYKDIPVWLSLENQNNYLMAAVAGLSSYMVKGGSDSASINITLNTHEEILDFVAAMQQYISKCIGEGRTKKLSINFEDYKL